MIAMRLAADRLGGRGPRVSRGGSLARAFAVPETYEYREHETTWMRYVPVIAMRLAANRLGRGRLSLTQRDGNEAQEGGGICSGLHVDFRNAVAEGTKRERAVRRAWVGRYWRCGHDICRFAQIDEATSPTNRCNQGPK